MNQQQNAVPKIDQDQQIHLNLEELEKIFNVYHANSESFFKSKAVLRDNNSSIPTLKEKALFFTCYDDSVYESVLDDLKREFVSHTKDKKKWIYRR